MDGNDSSQQRRPPRWLAIELWVVLMVLACAQAGLMVILGIGRLDTVNLETTLAGVAAGQFVDGPSTLYGPYSATNLRVLIQAPLYYRLTGLLAWPLVARGVPPVTAAFIAGRTISFVSFAVLLWVVARLARLDGAPLRAGAWSAALLLSNLIVETYPVTVRPDIAGVFLQTLGAYLVLRVTINQAPPSRNFAAAYVAFALAVCIKQHNIASALVSTIILAGGWYRRKDWRRAIERAWLAGLAIVVVYYLGEELYTGGGITNSLLKVSGDLRKMAHSAIWVEFGMFHELGRRSLLPLAMGLGCLFASLGISRRGRLDWILAGYLLAELVLVGLLTYRNEGAWVNYGLQSAVYLGILVGRALARVTERPIAIWRVAPLALLAPYLGVFWLAQCYVSAQAMAAEEQALHRLITGPELRGWNPAHVYFLGLPQYNRLYGRADWAHDEWLYGQFERIKAAPLRETWLRTGLTNGSIRLVVVPIDPPFVMKLDPPVPPGLRESLPDLGYDFVIGLNRFAVWERRRLPKSVKQSAGPRPLL